MRTHWAKVRVTSGPLKGVVGRVLGERDFRGDFEVLSCQGEYDMVDWFSQTDLEVIQEEPNDHTVFVFGSSDKFLKKVG